MAAPPPTDDGSAAAAAAAEPREKRYLARHGMKRLQEEEALWFSVPAPKDRWLALTLWIWTHILSYITMPRDFQAVVATCKTLRRAAGQRWFGHLSGAYFIPLKHNILACCTWDGALVTSHRSARICIWGDDFAGFAPTNSSSNREMGYRRKPMRELVIKFEEAMFFGITALAEWNGMLALAISCGAFGVIEVLQKDGTAFCRALVSTVVLHLVVWDGYLVSVGEYGWVYIFELGVEIQHFQISPKTLNCAIVFHGYLVISNDYYIHFYANPGCTLVHTLRKHESCSSALIVWGDLLAVTDFGITRSPTVILYDMNFEKVGKIELGYCWTLIDVADFWGFLWAINTLRGVAEIYGPELELVGHGRLPYGSSSSSTTPHVTTTFKDFVVFGAGIQLYLYRKKLSPPAHLFPL